MGLDIYSEVNYKSPDGKFNITMMLEGERTIVSTISGYEEVESTEWVLMTLRDFRQQIGKPLLLIGSSHNFKGISAKSRNMWRKDIWSSRSIVEKFAVFGVSFFIRSLINMFAKVSNTPMKSFDTQVQAKAWLEDTN